MIADASYSSLEDIARVQAKEQFGGWATIFVPGALFVSGLRADFDPADASPEQAVAGLSTPVLLVHSTTDEFTPSAHSEAIFASSDPAHTTLELTAWGAPHAMSYFTDSVAYAGFVGQFLAAYAPAFGDQPTCSRPGRRPASTAPRCRRGRAPDRSRFPFPSRRRGPRS